VIHKFHFCKSKNQGSFQTQLQVIKDIFLPQMAQRFKKIRHRNRKIHGKIRKNQFLITADGYPVFSTVHRNFGIFSALTNSTWPSAKAACKLLLTERAFFADDKVDFAAGLDVDNIEHHVVFKGV